MVTVKKNLSKTAKNPGENRHEFAVHNRNISIEWCDRDIPPIDLQEVKRTAKYKGILKKIALGNTMTQYQER